MTITRNPLTRLIHAHFFFVDIVGLSYSYMSTKTQIKKIGILNKCISETEEKTLADQQPTIETVGNFLVAKYEKHENIKGETIRLEW